MQDSNHYEDSANWEMGEDYQGNHTLSSELAPIGGSGAEGSQSTEHGIAYSTSTKAPNLSGQPQFSGDTFVISGPITVPASGFSEAPVPFNFQIVVPQPGLQFDPNAFEPSSTFVIQPALQQHQWQYGLDSQASLVFNSQEDLPQYPEQLSFNSELNSVFNTQPAFAQQYEQHGINFQVSPASGSQTLLLQPHDHFDLSLQPAIIMCTQTGCLHTFTHDADRVRHEASVHGVNRRAFFCHVPGCPKSTGTSYSRADKLKEHLYKKHANLGYTKRT